MYVLLVSKSELSGASGVRKQYDPGSFLMFFVSMARRPCLFEKAGPVSYLAEGDREDDFTYLQINLSHLPDGLHRLLVRHQEMHTGREASHEALFRLIE